MNTIEKIRSQARLNACEIQGVIDEAETGNISISGLLVIREDIQRMVLLYADEIQRGDDQDDQDDICRPHFDAIVTELRELIENIITMIDDETGADKDRIIGNLERLKKALLQFADA